MLDIAALSSTYGGLWCIVEWSVDGPDIFRVKVSEQRMQPWSSNMFKMHWLCWALMLMPLAGCSSSITPHENFRSIIGHSVGKSIDLRPSATHAYPEDLISTVVLPNGNVENQYKYRGACSYFYEINPKTRVIVGWRFAGSERDCAIVP